MSWQNLDSVVSAPPLPAIVAVLLVLGIKFLGKHIAMRADAHLQDALLKLASPLVLLAVVATGIQFLALAGFASRLVLAVLAAAIAFCGVLESIRIVKHKPHTVLVNARRQVASWSLAERVITVLCALILAFLFLAALGPETHPDALDYHLAVPLRLLETGARPVATEWMNGRLIGGGEWIIALGLTLGSDSFGLLTQFMGLVIVVAAVCIIARSRQGALLAVAGVISVPIWLFLATTSKPQLLPAAATMLAVFILVENWDALDYRRFLFVITLAMFAAAVKYSFLFSAGLICVLALWRGARLMGFAKSLLTVTAIYCVVMLPWEAWNYLAYNDPFSPLLANMLTPGDQGVISFLDYLRSARDTSMWFPASLFLPASLSTVSSAFGIAPLLVLLIRIDDKKVRIVLIVAVILCVVTFALGQKTSRFYIEPYFLLMGALAMARRPTALKQKIGAILVVPQLTAMAIGSLLAAVLLFPGALKGDWRQHAMELHAFGYAASRWLDESLPANATVLYGIRSVALSPRDFVSSDWLLHYDLRHPSAKTPLLSLVNRGVDTVVIIGERDKHPLAKCLGRLIAGPRTFLVETRNPFGARIPYSVSAYALSTDMIPQCMAGEGAQK